MNLTKKATQQPTNAIHFWQLLKKSWAELSLADLQPLAERILKSCKVVTAAKKGHFDESKDKEFFVFCI